MFLPAAKYLDQTYLPMLLKYTVDPFICHQMVSQKLWGVYFSPVLPDFSADGA